MKSTSKKRTPSIVNLTVKRRCLTEREIERLMDCARKFSRRGHRDATMILVAYRHGLPRRSATYNGSRSSYPRVACTFTASRMGSPACTLSAVTRCERCASYAATTPKTPHVFVSERGGPMSTVGFHHLVQRLGNAARMPFSLHPHMLRHACGYKLANDGHDTRALQHYLGHKNIQHTVRYTELSPDRFRDFWRGYDWRRISNVRRRIV